MLDLLLVLLGRGQRKRFRDREPPDPASIVPKFDPLRRDRLPKDYPLLEHVASWDEHHFAQWEQTPSLWYAVVFSVVAFVTTQLLRLIGGYLIMRQVLPLWWFAAALIALAGYLQRLPAWAIGALVVGVPVVFSLALFTHVAVSPTGASVLALLVALGVTAFFVDCVGTHAVRLLLAKSHRDDDWRTLWALRFSPARLVDRARVAEAEAAACLTRGEQGGAESHRRAAAFARDVASYRGGLFLIVGLVLVLACLSNPLLLLVVIPPPAALLWSSRAGLPVPWGDALAMLARGGEAWVKYGLRGEDSPAVFDSPAGSRVYRLALTLGAIVLLSAALSPPTAFLTIVLGDGDSDVAARLFFETVGTFVLPLLIIASLAVASLLRVLPHFEHASDPAKDTELSPLYWERLVARLQQSVEPRERRQLLLGFHATEHYPLFLPIETLHEHAHILGATGAGKTSRTVLPLISQLLSLRDASLRGPVVVIDLKPEPYLFQAVRADAERHGRTLKYFSNVTGTNTFGFNPVLDLKACELTPLQIGESIRAAMNLEHGSGYGRAHFSAVTRGWLSDVLEEHPDADSIREIDERGEARKKSLRTPAERERHDQAYELISTLRILARRPELNVTAGSLDIAPEVFRDRIAMSDVLEDDQVLYFHLDARSEEGPVRVIASLAITCLYTACLRRARTNGSAPRKHAYVFVDEFQTIAGRNFQLFMQQARGAGLALVLSNQSREDLIGTELLNGVDQNTAYRQFLTARTPDALRYVTSLAGLSEEGSIAVGEYRFIRTPTTRLNTNDLLTVSANSEISVMVQAVNRDWSQFDGQPVLMRSPFHVSEEQKTALEQQAWPELGASTLPLGLEAPSLSGAERRPTSPAAPRPREGTALAKRFARLVVGRYGYDFPEGHA